MVAIQKMMKSVNKINNNRCRVAKENSNEEIDKKYCGKQSAPKKILFFKQLKTVSIPHSSIICHYSHVANHLCRLKFEAVLSTANILTDNTENEYMDVMKRSRAANPKTKKRG